jgi:molybdopterin converting factor small subunit
MYTRGEADVEADGRTLAELVKDLDRRYPGIRFRIIDEQDRIRRHMKFFVAGQAATDLGQEIAPGAEVHILGALSGG